MKRDGLLLPSAMEAHDQVLLALVWDRQRARPAGESRRQAIALAMASAAFVTLPTESVVLISMSCLKMARASWFTASRFWARRSTVRNKTGAQSHGAPEHSQHACLLVNFQSNRSGGRRQIRRGCRLRLNRATFTCLSSPARKPPLITQETPFTTRGARSAGNSARTVSPSRFLTKVIYSSRRMPYLRRKNESRMVSGRMRRPNDAHFASDVTG